MSERADSQGRAPNGFSGRGGQILLLYYRKGDSPGSSYGCGVAMAAGFAAASLGRSYRFSKRRNNILRTPQTFHRASLSYKNLIARRQTLQESLLITGRLFIPISSTQDTVGPMYRSVAGATLLVGFISGKDEMTRQSKSNPRSLII